MTDLRISWNPILVEDFDYYLIYRGATIVGKAKTETFLDRDVPVGAHNYQVSAVDTHGNEGVKSDAFSRTSTSDSTTPPADPLYLRYRLENDHDVRLFWDHPSPEDLVFEIWLKRGAAAYVKIDETTSQSYLYIEGIPTGTTYKFKILARNEYNTSSTGYSNEVTITPGGPGTPSTLRIDSFPEGAGNKLSWETADQENIDYYLVYGDVDAAGYVVIAKTTSQSFEHRLLPANHIYSYKVSAVDHAGNEGTQSAVATVTIAAVPAAGDVRAVKAAGNTTIMWEVAVTTSRGRFVAFEVLKDGVVIGSTRQFSFVDKDASPVASAYVIRNRHVLGEYTDSTTLNATYTDPVVAVDLRYQLDDENDAALYWDHPNPESLVFEIWLKKDAAAYAQIDESSSQSFRYTKGVPEGSTYKFKVYARDSFGLTSTASNEITVTVADTPTAPVLGLVAPSTSGVLELSWTYPTTEPKSDYYLLQRNIAATGWVVIAKTSAQSYNDEPSVVGAHQYRVYAVAPNGATSAASNTTSATIPTPTAPVLDMVVPPTSGMLELSWIYPTTEPKPDYYLLQRNIAAAGWVVIAKTPAQSYNDEPNVVGAHQYRVYAISHYNISSTASNTKQKTIPTPTAPLIRSTLSQNDVRVYWTTPIAEPVPDHVLVYRRKDAGTYALVGKSSANSFSDSNLENGVYDYYVISVSKYGIASAASLTTTQTTVYTDTTPPSVPANLELLLDGSGIRVTWDHVPEMDFSAFHLYYKKGVGGSWHFITSTTSNRYLHSSLASGQTYYYKVQSRDTNGNLSAFSGEQSLAIAAPLTPSAPVASFVTTDVSCTLVLKWEVPGGPDPRFTSFKIYSGPAIDPDQDLVGSSTDTEFRINAPSPVATKYMIRAVGHLLEHADSAQGDTTFPTPAAPVAYHGGGSGACGTASQMIVGWGCTHQSDIPFVFEVHMDRNAAGWVMELETTDYHAYCEHPGAGDTFRYKVRVRTLLGQHGTFSNSFSIICAP